MYNAFYPNLLIGSKLALAIATGSPIQTRVANSAERKRLAILRMAASCESIKQRSRKLSAELKALETMVAADASNIKSASTRETAELMVSLAGTMVEHQNASHSRVEVILDEMMQLVRDGKESIPK